MNFMKIKLPISPENKLVRWANSIRGFYGHPVYLVGSQLTDKPNPRDVDIVVALPDDEFEIRFGDVYQWIDEGASGMWTELRWRWSDECIKRWKEGCLETGLNLDFKIQPMCQFEGFDTNKYPRLKIDTRNNAN